MASQSIAKSDFLYNAMVGSGGFATVFSALFVNGPKWVAIKEIKKVELLKHRSGVDMLTNELKALKRLDHPYVVPLHLCFHDNISIYMIFDLKLGGDLRHFLKHNVIFEEKDIAYTVSCLSSALKYIHSQGVIHRDIKPENVLIDQFGFPYLADFGVSYVNKLGDKENSTSLDFGLTSQLSSGTKQYIAPEVFCRGHIHGPESDFWSLGVVAYEMVYGTRPFKEHCPIEFIRYIDSAFKKQQENLKGIMNTKSTATITKTGTTTVATTGSNVNDSLSTSTDTATGGGVMHTSSSLPETSIRKIPHWDFAVNGNDALPANVFMNIPPESFMIGKVSNECRLLLKKLLEIRPTKRLGSIFNDESIFSQYLLRKYGVDKEKDVVRKVVQPFFVPGRKFLFSDENTYIHDPLSDPYLAARGVDVPYEEMIPESVNECFDSFSYISEKYSHIIEEDV